MKKKPMLFLLPTKLGSSNLKRSKAELRKQAQDFGLLYSSGFMFYFDSEEHAESFSESVKTWAVQKPALCLSVSKSEHLSLTKIKFLLLSASILGGSCEFVAHDQDDPSTTNLVFLFKSMRKCKLFEKITCL